MEIVVVEGDLVGKENCEKSEFGVDCVRCKVGGGCNDIAIIYARKIAERISKSISENA